MRSKLSTVNHQRRNRFPPPFNTERLQDPAVANNYVQQLEASLSTEEEVGATSFNDSWDSIRSSIGSVAEATLGGTVRVGKQRWFDEECQQLLDEKKAAYARKLQHGTRENMERYKRAQKQQNTAFKLRKRQLKDRDRVDIEQLFRQKATRNFYAKAKRLRKGFTPQADTCRDAEGNLLIDKGEV